MQYRQQFLLHQVLRLSGKDMGHRLDDMPVFKSFFQFCLGQEQWLVREGQFFFPVPELFQNEILFGTGETGKDTGFIRIVDDLQKIFIFDRFDIDFFQKSR